MEFIEVFSFALLSSLAAAVIAAGYLYRLLTTRHEYFVRQGLSGPDLTLPTGSWRGIWKSNIGEADLERIAKYGRVHGTFDGLLPNLIVADPALIKKVLHDNANHFRSRRAYQVKNAVLRNSLLSIEGYDSKDLKNLLSASLLTDSIKKLVPRVKQSIDSLVNEIRKEIKEDKDKDVIINATEKVRDYLSDVMAFTMLGIEFNAENKLKGQFQKVVEGAYFIKNPATGFAITPFLFNGLATLDDFVLNKSTLQFLTNLCHSTIQAKRKHDVDTSVAKAVDLLDLLLTVAEGEKQAAKEKGKTETDGDDILLNDDQIVTQMVSTVLSVIQVARYSLALSLHTVAKLPEVQDKLRFEVIKQLQQHHDFTFDLVQSCEYLDMFLGEILRLYPLEYRLERECAEDLTLGETRVEAGVLVSVPVYAIHRHKDFYPEPNTFEPDRFSADNSSKRAHYTYLPFGQAGASSTNIGIQLGVLITKLALAVLVSDFKWLPGDESKVPAELVTGITGVPRPKEILVRAETK